MSDPNGALSWRRTFAARSTLVAAAMFCALAAILIATMVYDIRANGLARAARDVTADLRETADRLSQGAEPAATIAAARARSGVSYVVLADREGAVLAAEGDHDIEGVADVESAAELDPNASLTLREGAVHGARTVVLPDSRPATLRIGRSLAASQAEVGRAIATGLLTTLAFLALALPAVAALVNRGAEPLRTLTRAVGRRGGAESDLARVAARGDEIGALAEAHLAISRRLSDTTDAVRRLTFDDPLTRLPNREGMRLRLASALQVGQSVALLQIGVSGLTRITTGLGGAAGDTATVGASERLRAAAAEWTRRSNVVASLGGDLACFVARSGEAEFALLAHGAGAGAAEELARLALAAFDTPLTVEDHRVTLGLAVGVALAPDHGDDCDALLRSATAALAVAQSAGPQTVRFAGVDLNDRAYGRLRIEQELRRALVNGELEVHYQPQIALRSGRTVGAEALVRWRHPTRGLVAPGEFIPIAEETGLVEQLGEFVLDAASRRAVAWASAGGPLRIAVNVSTLQFRNPRFAQKARHPARHGLRSESDRDRDHRKRGDGGLRPRRPRAGAAA